MSWNHILRLPLCLLSLASVLSVELAESAALAADKPTARKPEVRKLTIHPAPEPIPALRYQLLPDLLERTPGNAAVLYNRVLFQLTDQLDDETAEKIAAWAGDDIASDELPIAEICEALKPLDAVMSELAVAARRDSCRWDVPFREGQNPFAILLPELQQQRQLARVLVVNIRLAIQEGRVDDAIEMLKTGFALSRDVGHGPTLIHGLVGIAISKMITERVMELSQRADAPNLYWALAAMPRPLIDLRRGIETERHVLDFWMPEFRNLDRLPNDPEFWEARLQEFFEVDIRFLSDNADAGGDYRTVMTMLALKGYPRARDYMISRGHSPEEVASMHAAQVLLVYTMDTYRKLGDGSYKWFFLPYYEAREGLAEWNRQFKVQGRDSEVFPVASLLLPAIGAAKIGVARHQRDLEVARLVEAIRMHTATHGGRLPLSGTDISDVPIPTDPMWGRPFAVAREGETLVIESAPIPYEGKLLHGLRVEVQIAE